jgi:hypothetical protein
MLVALQKQCSPNDKVREFELRTKWKQLQMQKRIVDIDTWLRTWEITYDKCKEANLAEVQGDRPVYDFLAAIQENSRDFSVRWTMELTQGTEIEMKTLLKNYRDFRRTMSARGENRRAGAFSVAQGNTEGNQHQGQGRSPTFQGQNQNGKRRAWNLKCFCGEIHKWSQCPCINPAVRTKNFRMDRKMTEKADEFLKEHPEYKRFQYSNRSRGRTNESPSSNDHEDQMPTSDSESQHIVSMMAQSTPRVYAKVTQEPIDYILKKSFIIDSGATDHVCNNRTRFTTLYERNSPIPLLTANSEFEVQLAGTVDFTFSVQIGNRTVVRRLTLTDVLYAPELHTSVVSIHRLRESKLYWETKHLQLSYDSGDVFAYTPILFNMFVLEYIPNPVTSQAVFAISSTKKLPDTKGSVDQWHQRMGHMSRNKLEQLKKSTRGGVIQGDMASYDDHCEVCRLSFAKAIVSRRVRMRATAPYERVHYDLISIKPAANDIRYIAHFLDDFTRMNHIYVIHNRHETTQLATIQSFVAHVRRQYDREIKIFKLDGERGLQTRFFHWIKTNGYIIEPSPPRTPEPNGAIERSGGVLKEKVTALRTMSNLPKILEPEFFCAAAYLLNRSPTRSLNWETPIGKVLSFVQKSNTMPYIGHIRSYGCRAYPLRNKIWPEKKADQVSEPKAEIGFLVAYGGHNIFRIWVPSRNRIVMTRDSTFDERKKYDPKSYERDSAESIIRTVRFVDLEEQIPPRIQEEQAESQDQPQEERREDSNLVRTIDSQDEVQEQPSYECEKEQENPQLQTPAKTPEPSQIEEARSSSYDELDEALAIQTTAEPQAELAETPVEVHDLLEGGLQDLTQSNPVRTESSRVGADLDESNIVEGKRVRRRRAIYLTMRYAGVTGFQAAFTIAHSFSRTKLHRDSLPAEPQSWKEMINHQFREQFTNAALTEWNTLKSKDTFKPVRRDSVASNQILPLKWVFTYKFDQDGYIQKFKARIVVRGDLQRVFQFLDSYAATLAARVFRVLMAIAAFFDLDVYQFDVIAAFINARLDEEIFVRFPEGFEVQGEILQLLRALYGLKRSPLLWYREISGKLKELGVYPVPEAPCLFMNEHLIVFFYVDDICILCHPSHRTKYNEFREKLFRAYELRELNEVEWFLGIRIVRDRIQRKLWLCQDSYIEKLGTSFNVIERLPPKTPLQVEDLSSYRGKATENEIFAYQQQVGSINYAAIMTRPDISCAAQKLAEFMQNPGPQHLAAADRTISYLYGTRSLGIEYNGDLQSQYFQSSSDASYADDSKTRRSTQGFLFFLFGGPVDWRCTKQKTVTTSTTEAEFLALSHTASHLYWWRRFFKYISLELNQDYLIQCDNLQTVRLLLQETPKLVTKLRHVDIHSHWLRQEVDREKLKVEWISTSEMKADGFTKVLPRQKHENFVRQLNLTPVRK